MELGSPTFLRCCCQIILRGACASKIKTEISIKFDRQFYIITSRIKLNSFFDIFGIVLLTS